MKLKLLVPFVFGLFCGCSNTQQSIDIVPELYDSELKNISTENYFYIPKAVCFQLNLLRKCGYS